MIEWLIMALIGGGIAAVIMIAYLTISTIRDYIRQKRTEKAVKKHAVIFKQALENNRFKVMTGFFDDGETEISDAQIWEADSVDEKIASIPNEEVVVLR